MFPLPYEVLLQVVGQADVRRTRPRGGHGAKGAAHRAGNPVQWKRSVDRVAEILQEHRPRAIFFPHAKDWNSTHIGTHHLLQVPVPTWLKTIAIVDSVAMVIPVMVFLINIWYTVKGKLGDVHADIGAKFVFTGTIYYFFVNIQGSMMALPDVQRIVRRPRHQ